MQKDTLHFTFHGRKLQYFTDCVFIFALPGPYMVCDSNGDINALSFFQQSINDGPSKAIDISCNQAQTTPSAESSGIALHRPSKKQKQSSSSKATNSLLPFASLTDLERSQLHIEIYNYFSWLHAELVELETTNSGRNRIRREGISVPGVQNLMSKLESTFRDVGEHKLKKVDANRKDRHGEQQNNVTNSNVNKSAKGTSEIDDDANNDSEKENTPPQPLPLLEIISKKDLDIIVTNITQEEQSSTTGSSTQDQHSSRQPRTFDQMYQLLLAYKEEKGHVNVTNKHMVGDICLGRWVADLRSRKKSLSAQQEDSVEEVISLPVSPGRLGLTLEFPESQSKQGGSEVWCVITAIESNCPFKDYISVGDRLLTIDGVMVSKAEDFEAGRDKDVRTFRFLVSKKTGKGKESATFLTPERVVSMK